MSTCSIRSAVTVIAVALGAASASASGADHLELGVGSYPWAGGANVAVTALHRVAPGLELTANVAGGQRNYILSDGGVDRRTASLGVGARARLFPGQAFGPFATAGVGVGRVSFAGSWHPAAWHALFWNGMGVELRISDRAVLAFEARAEWLQDAPGGGDLPLRLSVRLPIGQKSVVRASR